MAGVLSAGIAVWRRLADDRLLTATVTRVFPVVADEATLPYVAYRRTGLDQRPVKALRDGTRHPCDTARIEVAVCSAGYEEGVRIAERIRERLDGCEWSAAGLNVRSCTLVDAEETWNEDCFVQTLVFEVRI